MNSRILARVLNLAYFAVFAFGMLKLIDKFVLIPVGFEATEDQSRCDEKCKTAVQDEFRLSHVIIPFHYRQANDVIATVKKWSKYQPCTRELDPETRSKMPRILFYLGYSSPRADLKKLREDLNELTPHLTNCFSNGHRIDLVEFKMDSNVDNRIYGSAAMFEHMLAKRDVLFADATYVFYIEADARPVRSDWLYAVNREIGWNRFWLRGCSYTGDKSIEIRHTRDLMYAYGWNGNAIYNIGDEAFRRFYLDTIKPYVRGSQDPYDWYIIRYILDETKWRDSTRLLHKFLYTDVIVNTYALLERDLTMDEFAERYPHAYFSHRFIPKGY